MPVPYQPVTSYQPLQQGLGGHMSSPYPPTQYQYLGTTVSPLPLKCMGFV
jgi:hypothetical protein